MATEDPENTTPTDEPTADQSAAPEAVEPVVEDPVAAAVAAEGEEAPAAETPVEAGESDGLADDLTLGEGAPADVDTAPKPAPVIRGKVDRFGVAMGTGRRKTAIARVRVKTGQGSFTVNGKSVEEHFPVERDQKLVYAPLNVTETLGKVDVWCRVEG
ncbi:MAG: uS9 family ribosomal protein, partial [Planctomycetota bacterium]